MAKTSVFTLKDSFEPRGGYWFNKPRVKRDTGPPYYYTEKPREAKPVTQTNTSPSGRKYERAAFGAWKEVKPVANTATVDAWWNDNDLAVVLDDPGYTGLLSDFLKELEKAASGSTAKVIKLRDVMADGDPGYPDLQKLSAARRRLLESALEAVVAEAVGSAEGAYKALETSAQEFVIQVFQVDQKAAAKAAWDEAKR